MPTVLSAREIRVEKAFCVSCERKMSKEECDIAVYSHVEEDTREIECYIPSSLFHCKYCNLFYVDEDEIVRLNNILPYKILVLTDTPARKKVQKAKKKKKKSDMLKRLTNEAVNQMIIHKKYGNGIIKAFDGEYITVNFSDGTANVRLNISPKYINNYHFPNQSFSSKIVNWSKRIGDCTHTNFKTVTDFDIRSLQVHNIVQYGSLAVVKIKGTTRSFCTFKVDPILLRRHLTDFRSVIVGCLGKDAEVNIIAEYCYDCLEYKIDMPALNYYEAMYGKLIILPHRFNDHFIGDISNVSTTWNKSTPLKDWGYTVRADGLTKAERQRLLCYLIDNELMLLSDVIFYIKQAISMSVGMNYLQNIEANAKRRDDLSFLEQRYIALQDAFYGKLEL